VHGDANFVAMHVALFLNTSGADFAPINPHAA
jgi:hypothetical protein